MKKNPTAELLTVSEAAAILGVSDTHIKEMIASKTIGSILCDNEHFLNSDHLERVCQNPQNGSSSSIRRVLPWLIAATTLTISVGSLLPGLTIDRYDQEMHWFAYLFLSCQVTCYLTSLKRALLGNGLVLVLGAFLECAQQFIGGRHFGYNDLAANYLGVISGIILGALLRKRGAGIPRQGREGQSEAAFFSRRVQG